jgi:hypothetical protein
VSLSIMAPFTPIGSSSSRGVARPPAKLKDRATVSGKFIGGHSPGRGKGSVGLGLGKSGAKRHRYVFAVRGFAP